MNLRRLFFIIPIVLILIVLAKLMISDLNSIWARPQKKENQKAYELRKHVQYLTNKVGVRHPIQYENLEKAKNYIMTQLQKNKISFRLQSYRASFSDEPAKVYSNIIIDYKGKSRERFVVGVHYDSASSTVGADDNASGTAVLIELAKRLKLTTLKHDTSLVFFTLEEPPAFATRNMGSRKYAESLKKSRVNVKLMLSLEMLGFYSEKNIQRYPVKSLAQRFGKKANFLAFVGIQDYASVTTAFNDHLKNAMKFRSVFLLAPKNMPGISLSDHRSFWQQGYAAALVTDTSFYRNANYHTDTDTIMTLDFTKMYCVLDGLHRAILKFDEAEKDF